jgi:hypothetical protein
VDSLSNGGGYGRGVCSYSGGGVSRHSRGGISCHSWGSISCHSWGGNATLKKAWSGSSCCHNTEQHHLKKKITFTGCFFKSRLHAVWRTWLTDNAACSAVLCITLLRRRAVSGNTRTVVERTALRAPVS